MTTFKQFLLEDEFNVEKFKKDCAFFLEHAKGRIMYTGVDHQSMGEWSLKEWAPRKAPRDTPRELHDDLNAYFQKRFGVPARNWRFATGDVGVAETYADSTDCIYAIFPVGKFEWLSATTTDMGDLYGVWLAAPGRRGLPHDEQEQLANEHVMNQVKKANWCFNTDLPGVIDAHNEIMYKCQTFYAISFTSDAFKAVKALA